MYNTLMVDGIGTPGDLDQTNDEARKCFQDAERGAKDVCRVAALA